MQKYIVFRLNFFAYDFFDDFDYLIKIVAAIFTSIPLCLTNGKWRNVLIHVG